MWAGGAARAEGVNWTERIHWLPTKAEWVSPVPPPPLLALVSYYGFYIRDADPTLPMPPQVMRPLELGFVWAPVRLLPIPGDPYPHGYQPPPNRMQLDQNIAWGASLRLFRLRYEF
jgi:hypothetical protein